MIFFLTLTLIKLEKPVINYVYNRMIPLDRGIKGNIGGNENG